MRALRSALLALALLMPVAAGAVQPEEVMKDPSLEKRARAISSGLRCLVCQNQSIDDSDAPLARDLRLIVRERLRQGDDDDAVLHYVVQRYGEFVLLRPVVAWHTALLWLTPVLVVGLGGLALAAAARRRKAPAPKALSAAEEEAVADLMRRAEPR
ncbi:cytochrome c-type biogenesis protein CcmH [Methylobacterium currus]|uniref:Cytochrome c-type biogenesis protein n=1 Tax=Methylobacterium currus TaxID=2051553 RepID=A0A2R4WJ69_9HYPH|nr:cytochrome c-type biogenesis protein [Methylobacterium currus]AWB21566.1 cytochrome c-type biogenesis protein CcmH [Methylobacterium currus]UHC18816.1 cytochrome c-type biogenesis protein CcmH [Methylobacterium currus]